MKFKQKCPKSACTYPGLKEARGLGTEVSYT